MALLVWFTAKQPELRRVAGRFGKPEVPEGVARDQAPARRALQEAALNEIGLDDVLDGIPRFGQRSRQRIDADRSAAVTDRDRVEIAAIHSVETGGIDFKRRERCVGDGAIDS